MGLGKIVKKLAVLVCLGLLILLCLSGPLHTPDRSVRPLFGTMSVQLSSGKYPVDTRELKAVIQADEIGALELFPKLVSADLSGSSCYEEMIAWGQANPQVQLRYTVSLPDGSSYDNSTSSVDLSALPAGSAAAAAQALQNLPALEQLSLGNVGGGNAGLTLEDLALLREALPDVDFAFTLDLLGQSVSPDVTSLDLSGLKSEQVDEAVAVLSCLGKLEEVKLGEESGSAIGWEEIGRLAGACPSACFDYRFPLYGKTVNLNDEKLDFNHSPITDEGAAVRQVLPYMRRCRYLDMDYCGVSNESMAAIRDENPNVDVVWRIWFGENYSVRTDTERILASKPTVGGMLSEASVLQYCTKLKYLDLGHNEELSDLSFVSSMPELEVLIIAMTNISDLRPLANCPKLEYLEIQTCRNLSDLSPLAGLSNLAHLNICELPLVEDIRPLYGLNKLERLWIGDVTPIPEEQVQEIRGKLPACTVNTSTHDPHGEAWRYSRYDPDEPKYYWVPRHELLREQLGYNYQEYSFYWLDPLCGDPAPAEHAGKFGKEVYGIK